MLAYNNLNLGDEHVPIGQQPVVPAAGGEPLDGIDFLLHTVDERLMKNVSERCRDLEDSQSN